jgi:Gamma-glutamyl cyclotransferase, AIG2-like
VLSGLGERDFALLDRYEEVPRLYTRVKVEVASAGGVALRCWIYLQLRRCSDPGTERRAPLKLLCRPAAGDRRAS